MTDPLGQSQVIPYLIELSKSGYKFTIISFEKAANYQKRQAEITSLLNQHSIKWEVLIYHKSPPVISTIYDLYLLRNKAIDLNKKKPFQLIHCRSYLTSLTGLYLKKKLGIPFIFDMRGFWPDERVDGKIWKLSNPVYKAVYSYFKKKESEFISNADYTISLTENARKEIHSWNQIKNQPAKIEVIPCCADLNYFSQKNIDQQKQNHFRKNFNITSSDFIISYSGSIGSWYLLDEMLDFFKRLLLIKNSARFLFITPDHPSHILEKAKIFNIPADKFIIYSANRSEVPSLLSLSIVSIFFIMPVYSKKASSPTKQGEIMGMGIPIICNCNVGDTDMVIESSKAGWLVKEFNHDEYDKAILQIDNIISLEKRNIIKGAENFYSLEKGAEKYKRVYEKILGNV
jgi:glycosyltransferase involved in cell wall biosynthesis